MHGKRTDIEDTKEQIKVELMGEFDDKKTNYTNTDVIAAVYKITGETVEANTPSVKSRKGNDVDIADLWIPGDITINFCGDLFTFPYGTKWKDALPTICEKKGGSDPGYADSHRVCINSGNGEYIFFKLKDRF